MPKSPLVEMQMIFLLEQCSDYQLYYEGLSVNAYLNRCAHTTLHIKANLLQG